MIGEKFLVLDAVADSSSLPQLVTVATKAINVVINMSLRAAWRSFFSMKRLNFQVVVLENF